MSATKEILKHLKTGAAITPIQALEKYGCMRLAARIKDLRDMDYKINTHKLQLKCGKIVASYRMAVRK